MPSINMLRINNLVLDISDAENKLLELAEKRVGCKVEKLNIVKKSIDARRKNSIKYIYSVDVEIKNEKNINQRLGLAEVEPYEYTFGGIRGCGQKVVVVGSGPAGLFSALTLAQNGYSPIVLERGKNVDERTKDILKFNTSLYLDTESNVQFGEGGAGTFSDGKLTTGINDYRIKKVLTEFVRFGAPEEILYLAKPHLGTDKLKNIVKSMREEIISLGGGFRFSSRVVDLEIENNKVVGLHIEHNNEKYFLETKFVILCTGHSARDTIKMLYKKGIKMLPKAFSIGARIEHPREIVNNSCYGDSSHLLPTADYKLFTHLKNGRGVYSFCMCPGGEVINSSSENRGLVTNGMSRYARDDENSNSAILVSVIPNDYNNNLFGGIELQRNIESAAYKCTNSYEMPCVKVGDFLKSKLSNEYGCVRPSVKTGTVFCNFDDIFPIYINSSMREGIICFGKKFKAFEMEDAVLTAPETRSSSPVSFVRDEDTYQTSIEGVLCAGEGGGHAGGITSSAVDGIKAAEKISLYINKHS